MFDKLKEYYYIWLKYTKYKYYDIINRYQNHNNKTSTLVVNDEDTSLYDSEPIKDVKALVTAYREKHNIIDTEVPNFDIIDYLLEPQLILELQYLKAKLSSVNVNNKEKYINTIKAYYFNQPIYKELLLIDSTLIKYINYFESNMGMVVISLDDINKVKINKDAQVDITTIKNILSCSVYEYEISRKNGTILPLNLFVFTLVFKYMGGDTTHIEKINNIVKLILTAYSAIYNKSIPEDYVTLDGNTRYIYTEIYYLLNNIEVPVETKPKTKLSLIK